MFSPTDNAHPHHGTPVLQAGTAIEQAKSALILLHGRGAAADDMIGLAQAFRLPQDMVVLAPQAAGYVWYPQRFIAPLEANEPYLSSALRRIDEVVAQLDQAGIPAKRIILGGFSQGASLAIEYVLRSGRRWGGLLAFSGGYIWPAGQPRPAEPETQKSLDGTPAFLGCADVDPHIPTERFHDSAHLLAALGARVNKQVYPGMGHTIIQSEIDAAQEIITALA